MFVYFAQLYIMNVSILKSAPEFEMLRQENSFSHIQLT